MTQRQSYRVKMVTGFTFRPTGGAWHKDFPAGWEGAVTPDEFTAIMAAGDGQDKSRATRATKPDTTDEAPA